MIRFLSIGFANLAVAIGTFAFLPPQGVPAPARDRDFDEALHKKCLYPTIRISDVDVAQKSTGFIIRSEKDGDVYYNVALTCAHCVSDVLPYCDPGSNPRTYMADIGIYDDEGTSFQKWDRYPAVVYACSHDLDLAVILFKTPTQQPTVDLDFARSMCIGNQTFKIGCGIGEEPRYDVGYINSLVGKVRPHPTDCYRTSMPTIFGDSGGPAFYKNKVIGLMQAIKVTRMQGTPVPLTMISICIPIGTVKTWDTKENNTLRFIYTPKAELPRLPSLELNYLPVIWGDIEHEGD